MDRAPSQLENVRPSGLKQPSRLPAMASSNGRTLLETSQSDLNVKTAPGMRTMGPPGAMAEGGVKHKIAGLPEPPSKRKTLAERAGEPLNPQRSHMPQPSKPSFTKSEGFFHAGAAGRSQPNMGNVMSTTGYRNASNTSTASSASSVRPASRQNIARQRVADPHALQEEAEAEAGIMGKRKGTPLLSFNPSSSITLRKTRTAQDLRSPQQQQPRADVRTASQHSASHIRSLSSSTCSGSNGSSRTCSGDSNSDHHRNTSTTSKQPSTSQQEDSTTPRSNSTRNTSLITAFADLSLTPKPKTQPKTYFRNLSAQRPSGSKHRPSLSPVKESITPTPSPSKIPKFSCTPSLRHAQSTQALVSTPSPFKAKHSTNGFRSPAPSASKRAAPFSASYAVREACELPVYLTKEKLTPSSLPAWDTKGRLEDMESMYATLRQSVADAADSKRGLEESLGLYKSRVQELASVNKEITSSNKNLNSDLERARNDLHATITDLRQARRDHERDVQDAEKKHERDLSDLYAKQERESQKLERELEKIAENGEKELEAAKREWEKRKDDETAEMTTRHWEEIEEMSDGHRKKVERLEKEIEQLKQAGESRASESAGEVQDLRDKLSIFGSQMEAAEATAKTLQAQISAAEARGAALEQEKAQLVSKTHFLEGNQEAQSHEFTTMRDQLSAAKASEEAVLAQLRKEEMARRKLNAQILELKGNIRVFVRTRPLLPTEADDAEPMRVEYPDLEDLDGGKEMAVYARPKHKSSIGGEDKMEKHSYGFDRVFTPATPNSDVFAECRELIQSVVDGYNVSILSYGQTGSGKTYGMSGPEGIIPSSIALLLEEMQRLRAKGWEYTVDAAFVEVYNETLNDLLGDAKTWDESGAEDLGANTRASVKKKERHEIHHDPITGKTTVSNLSSVPLWPPPASEDAGSDGTSSYTEQAVTRLLDTAAKNRRVAATKSNERSSRSHSIFILTLRGSCATTGEASEGMLNLVDLAGSERLKQSGAEGSRMKETQAINKSLSSLGDVIASLGSKKEESHVPYRNSKLTWLLKSSLGGTAKNGKSSRTLMLLHLSPLSAHWEQSKGSLEFGNKVHGTHIGAAKKR